MTRHTDPVTHFPISTIWLDAAPPGDWAAEAACRHHAARADSFTEPRTGGDARAAVAICGGCPVRAACLDYGQDLGADGVWGGRLRGRGVARAPGPARPGVAHARRPAAS